mmetsp:Transcript_22460/g.57745  ORF Transcript_22460/g.57745 Transcript_22460/m.57745 type:complete len:95 (+) Transcript_22460:220-504(+)
MEPLHRKNFGANVFGAFPVEITQGGRITNSIVPALDGRTGPLDPLIRCLMLCGHLFTQPSTSRCTSVSECIPRLLWVLRVLITSYERHVRGLPL